MHEYFEESFRLALFENRFYVLPTRSWRWYICLHTSRYLRYQFCLTKNEAVHIREIAQMRRL